MDIEQIQKLINNKIEAGNKVKEVRKVIKTYKTQKQDMYDDTSEILKPSIKVQKELKKTIDEKQDKIIKQLQENQLGINTELRSLKDATLDVLTLRNELPFYDKPLSADETPFYDKPPLADKTPLAIEKPPIEKPPIEKLTIINPNNKFNENEKKILINYNFPKPSELLTLSNSDLDELKTKSTNLAKKLGPKIQHAKTSKEKELYKIEINALKKYRETINDIFSLEEYKKQTGTGIYTQKKRNAYKISQKGQYGGLVIDLPKLQGHLKVVAHKNGQKVYDKQADFDTLDLLTKRFNSKKNYSELARSVFSDLNRLSKIPIHRTSKKYSKLGSGVVYYNNPKDLLSRLELLGGSMSAGNNSSDVREEFVKIVHRLNKLNVIDNKQVNDLIKEYLI